MADAGAAYVFARSAGAWTRRAKLTADGAATAGAAGDQFGYSVALTEDTALVGAPWHDSAGRARSGAAYVFTRSGAAWTLQQTLTAATVAGDQLGYAVALAEVTALVGAPFHDAAGKDRAGAAYVFLTSPFISLFTPTSGPVGTVVTVTGTDFTGVTAVTFNGVAAIFSVGSAARITATVPAGASSGRIAVTAAGSTVTSAARFTVIPAPSLTRLKPAAAERGATVTISGSGFGAKRGTSFVKFGVRKCATYLSWSNTKIKCKVPATAKYGAVECHGDDGGRQEQRRELHGEALTADAVRGAKRDRRPQASASSTASAGVPRPPHAVELAALGRRDLPRVEQDHRAAERCAPGRSR